MKWIKVEDKIPEKNVEVLVTNGERVKAAEWCKRTDRDGYHFMWTTMKNITHWMPLPEPPKY